MLLFKTFQGHSGYCGKMDCRGREEAISHMGETGSHGHGGERMDQDILS